MKCANVLEQVRLQSPIGIIVVEFCKNGLHSVNQAPEITDATFDPKPGLEVVALKGEGMNKSIQSPKDCTLWLDTYFNNQDIISEVNVPKFCTIDQSQEAPFYDKVYSALLTVPFGKTVSYKELASLAGSPNAVRAVGSAMAKNPFQLVVPCHRVLPSPTASGKQSAGNYSSGKKVSVKVWLLQHEGHKIADGLVL